MAPGADAVERDDGDEGTSERSSSRNKIIAAYVGVLAVIAGTLGVWAWTADVRPPGEGVAWTLPLLGLLLVAAEYLFVRFRYRGDTNALNLVEAVLAPLIYAFAPATVIATVIVTQVVAALLRRNAPIKASFNIVQWTLAATVGTLVIGKAALTGGMSLSHLAVLLAALGAIGVVNQLCFSIVLALANKQSVREVLAAISDAIFPGWLAGWILNSTIGILFVVAYDHYPPAVLVFAVPLVVLHLAYRGFAGARSDRLRLAGLHRAAELLATPFDPHDAIEPFLQEVARSFEARVAQLVLREDGIVAIHVADTADGSYRVDTFEEPPGALERLLLEERQPVRVDAGLEGPLARAATQAGWRDCLSAPLIEHERIIGVLLVANQAGLEGFEEGEAAVIEALARETAGTLSKGRLLETVLLERQQLGDIVSSASDGIFTIDRDGVVQSWNKAMERLSGCRAEELIGKPGGLARLQVRTPHERRVDLETWTDMMRFPEQIFITSSDGRSRRLSCSFSRGGSGGDEPSMLVVVARDVTPEEQIAQLRREVDKAREAHEAQRLVVEELQRALFPTKPSIESVQFGVRYVPSDPASPTGGDLYDWYVLPNGEVHVAVVDVLGHGVSATKNAVSVIHTLRTLALADCPLGEVVSRADALLQRHDPDLVATVQIARYDPATGRISLAGGGHPPALRVAASGAVMQVPTPGGAIGWPLAGSQGTISLELKEGDSVIFYTDGLIEAGKDILAGEETLLRNARYLSDLSAEEIASGLIERILPSEERRDDTLTLVLRRAATVERKMWNIDAVPRHASQIRREAATWLGHLGVDDLTLEEVELLSSELLANAVTAARTRVSLAVAVGAGEITVEVTDDGVGHPNLEGTGQELPSEAFVGGRGLYLVRALADDLTFMSTHEGTSVRIVKQLTADDPRNGPDATPFTGEAPTEPRRGA